MQRFYPFALAALLAACSGADPVISDDLRCQSGIYRLDNGALIDIGLSGADALRWRTLDGQVGRISPDENGVWSGTLGWTERPHPARITLGDCTDTRIHVTGIDGVSGSGARLDFDTRDIQFESDGESLAGRLILPHGEAAVPLVVLVHGSERSSARDYYYHQRMLPAQGIAVFVYDKRGTGGSGGAYTQDFYQLAADAADAYRTATELAGSRVEASGYFGGSQGGWVAPLAASMTPADFVIASYGMVESPLAEDREQVQMELREAGYGEDVLAAARELTDATGYWLATDFTDGAEEILALKAQYSEADWFSAFEGEITGEILRRPLWQFRIGYAFMGVGTSWGYEPVPVLRSLDVPMLWVLGGADREAPSEPTRSILADLQSEGRAIDIAYYPETDHGIVRFDQDESGARETLGYAASYFPLIADWLTTRQMGEAPVDAEFAPRQRPSQADND